MIKKNSIFEIRLAKIGEASAISDILYHSFIEYKPLYTDKAFTVTTLSVHEIENRIYKSIVWIALYNNVIAGTISIMPDGDALFIKSMAVSPIVRRKGLGKELIRHAIEIAEKEEAKYLELTTTTFLYEAIRLYELFGFEQYGYEDLYGTTLIKLKKNLKAMSISLMKKIHSDQ